VKRLQSYAVKLEDVKFRSNISFTTSQSQILPNAWYRFPKFPEPIFLLDSDRALVLEMGN